MELTALGVTLLAPVDRLCWSPEQASGLALSCGPVESGWRIMLAGQADRRENGIWVAAEVAWERAPDMAEGSEVDAAAMAVCTSGVNAGKIAVLYDRTIRLSATLGVPMQIGRAQIGFIEIHSGVDPAQEAENARDDG
jgi:hypothetical protein